MVKKILTLFLIFLAISVAYGNSEEITSVSIVSRRGYLDIEKASNLFFEEGTYEPVREILGLEDYNFFIQILEVTSIGYAPSDRLLSHNGLNFLFGAVPGQEEIVYGTNETASILASSDTATYRIYLGHMTRTMIFNRYLLYEVDNGYKIARVSLGVWI